jgi:transcriptional regulator with XRE-family HTH domain
MEGAALLGTPAGEIEFSNYQVSKDNLRELRRKSGLTQAQLSKRLGIGQSIVSKWEAGLLPISSHLQSDLLELFDNRNDDAHPLIMRLVCKNARVSLISKNKRFLSIAQVLSDAFKLGPSECNEDNFHQIFRPVLEQIAGYYPSLNEAGVGVVYPEVDADLCAKKEHGNSITLRVNSRVHIVKLGGKASVTLIESDVTGPGTGCIPAVEKLESSRLRHING